MLLKERCNENLKIAKQVKGSAGPSFVDRWDDLIPAFAILQMTLHLGHFLVAKDPRMFLPHMIVCLQR